MLPNVLRICYLLFALSSARFLHCLAMSTENKESIPLYIPHFTPAHYGSFFLAGPLPYPSTSCMSVLRPASCRSNMCYVRSCTTGRSHSLFLLFLLFLPKD
jgi:hypothetical protein